MSRWGRSGRSCGLDRSGAGHSRPWPGPNLAAAYSSVEKHEASRASSAYTVVHRVGGSLGTAILTVVLQRSLAGAPPGPASSAGFGHTFWWALALCVLALIPAAFFPARRATAKP